MADIFRISDDTELTIEKLNEYIQKNREISALRYEKLRDMYITDFYIFHQEKKDTWKPDNRIAVNFPKYIIDTMNGYFIGIPIKVTAEDEKVSEYVNLIDAYNGQDDGNAELAKQAEIYGRAYEMYYVDERGNIGITHLSPIDAFMIYDESIIERPKYFVRTYKDTNNEVHGSVSDDTTVRYFDVSPTLRWIPDSEKAHGFDGVPAVEYVCNADRQGLFEPVMSMVNAYNKSISEKANDIEYFSDAYLKIIGAPVDNKDIQHIRSNRIINFDDTPNGLQVEFLQKPMADESQEHLYDRLERLIFQISMVANISDSNFGEASGISLRYKLQPMSNLAMTLERKFTASMQRRYQLIFSNPVSGMPADAYSGLRFTFTRNIPANRAEEAEIAAKLAGVVSTETQLSVLSIVDDVNKEIERKNAETAAALDAIGLINGQ